MSGKDWDAAQVSAPSAYKGKDGRPFLVFPVYTGRETILPMDPLRMYREDEQEVQDCRLSFYSSEETFLGQLPFYSCIKALSAYALEFREPQVRIRALSIQEAERILRETEREIQARQGWNRMFEKNLEFIGLDGTDKETVDRVFHGHNVRTVSFEVEFPTGMLAAADPLCYLPDPASISWFHDTVLPGKYTIVVSVVNTASFGTRVSGMKLQISGRPCVSYVPAESYFREENARKDVRGFPVETGMASFCDRKTVEAYQKWFRQWRAEHPDGNFYNDHLARLFRESYEKYPGLQREGGDFIQYTVPGTALSFVMAASGLGDGWYSVFRGIDADGETAEFVMLFIDPALTEA